jgi:hypothetical protein
MTFPTEWKNKIHVPNHQPDMVLFLVTLCGEICGEMFLCMLDLCDQDIERDEIR